MSSSDPLHRLTEHLFRHESARLVAVLTGQLGVRNLELAEDVVQEAIVRAFRTWPYHGIPADPAAWLMRTAKNLALDILRREHSFREKEAEIVRTLGDWGAKSTPPPDSEITDDFLRLLFTCCHPVLTTEQQIALSLKVVCSFNNNEIARAFLTTEAAIAKRLTRARSALRQADAAFALPEGPELPPRLTAVLRTLYLLFNEGHSATGGDQIIRRELCDEAIRLGSLLATHSATSLPPTHALLALFCLNAARLPARVDFLGDIVRLEDQDRALWDQSLIQRGIRHLALAACGTRLSEYHLQAAISACHCLASDDASTDWPRILSLYDDLAAMTSSPVVLLNRAVAVAKVHGAARAVDGIAFLADGGSLGDYPLAHAVLGDLELRRERPAAAALHFKRAVALSTSAPERDLFAGRLQLCTKS